MELLYSEQLNHITARDKLQHLFMKQPIEDKKHEMQQLLSSMLSVKALQTKMQREITRFELLLRSL